MFKVAYHALKHSDLHFNAVRVANKNGVAQKWKLFHRIRIKASQANMAATLTQSAFPAPILTRDAIVFLRAEKDST